MFPWPSHFTNAKFILYYSHLEKIRDKKTDKREGRTMMPNTSIRQVYQNTDATHDIKGNVQFFLIYISFIIMVSIKRKTPVHFFINILSCHLELFFSFSNLALLIRRILFTELN